MTSITAHITITPRELCYLSQDNDVVLYREEGDENFLKTLYKSLNLSYSKFYKMDGMARLGFVGAEFLLNEKTNLEDCALLFINKHATLSVDKAYQESLSDIASPGLFVYTLPNIVQGEICIRHKIFGENYTFVEKEFTAESLFEKAEVLFASADTKQALLGCLDYVDDENYELCMLLVEDESDNHSRKFNLTELNNIFESLYK